MSRRCAHDLVPLFESGVLRPVIDRTFRLDEVAAAHEYVASNANVGKVLLDGLTGDSQASRPGGRSLVDGNDE